MDPEQPHEDTPDLNVNSPDTPLLPAFDVRIEIEPLVFPVPDTIRISPPVLVDEVPAKRFNPPPLLLSLWPTFKNYPIQDWQPKPPRKVHDARI